MSTYFKLELCKRCGVMTNHTWLDDTPKHHEYTVECGKCKLRTHESKWQGLPDSGTIDIGDRAKTGSK